MLTQTPISMRWRSPSRWQPSCKKWKEEPWRPAVRKWKEEPWKADASVTPAVRKWKEEPWTAELSATPAVRKWKEEPWKAELSATPAVRKWKEEPWKAHGSVTPAVRKYWSRRYTLFSKYDAGIRMDEEGWYSVTPELIARQQALRCATPSSTVIDAFCGVGGNSIQFALRCQRGRVIAIDKDPEKISCAKNNARIYGVEHRIEFIVGDFFELAPTLKADVVFLSPPWGGPNYVRDKEYDLNMLQPESGFKLFEVARKISPNLVFFLPKNVSLDQLRMLSRSHPGPPIKYEVQQNIEGNHIRGVTVYYGDFADHTKEETSWLASKQPYRNTGILRHYQNNVKHMYNNPASYAIVVA